MPLPFTLLFWVHVYNSSLWFLSRKDPLAFVGELVWWCWILWAFACLERFWFLLHIWMRSISFSFSSPFLASCQKISETSTVNANLPGDFWEEANRISRLGVWFCQNHKSSVVSASLVYQYDLKNMTTCCIIWAMSLVSSTHVIPRNITEGIRPWILHENHYL